jgi:hypothetical protein
MMKPSTVAKLLVSHLAALVCAYTAHQGVLKLAALLGTATGKRLAPVLNPLLTSDSPKRQALGIALAIGAIVPLSFGAGAFGASVTLLTFASVEKHVSELLADEDWTRIDEIAEPLFDEIQRRRDLYTVQSRIFGVVPAILQALGFNAIHIYEGTTGDEAHEATVH